MRFNTESHMGAHLGFARQLILTWVAILTFALMAPASSQPLNDFFDVRATTIDPSLANKRFAICPRPPPAVINLRDVVFYTDAANSVLSTDKWQERRALTTPIRSFAKTVTRMADDFVQTRPLSSARARCVATWIEAWAQAGAFLGEVSTWARYDTLWFGQIQLAVAYLKVRHDPAISAETHRTIQTWLSAVARAAVAEQDTPQFQGKLTNIRAWTAAAAAVAGVAANDRALLDYAVTTTRAILQTVTTDGALPAELARGRRAFIYHIWALEPLALTTLIAERNGMLLAKENDNALRRVFEFVLRAQTDPKQLVELSGVEQDDSANQWPRPWELGAFEMFLSIETHPAIEALIRRRRPIESPFTGGDWSRTLARTIAP